MKIAVCARTWGENGGIGVYTRQIVSAMLGLDTDDEIHVLLSDDRFESEVPQSERSRVVTLAAAKKPLWDQWSVPRYARANDIDMILHAKFTVPVISPCKTSTVIHGTERFVFPEYHQTSDLWFFRSVYPRIIRKADHLLSVSQKTKDDIVRFLDIDPQNVTVSHLAADPMFRRLDDESILAAVREQHQLPKSFVLFAGHLYPGKNFGRLVEALAQVRQDVDVDCVVAGGKRWKYEDDVRRIDELGLNDNIHFLGSVPQEQLVALYNLADATVFPSHYESFGLINIEAQACGCPLVTSNTGGSPEVAGDAAVYVDPMSVDSIADGIRRALTDDALRAQLVDDGYRNASRFSWTNSARTTLDALRPVAGR